MALCPTVLITISDYAVEGRVFSFSCAKCSIWAFETDGNECQYCGNKTYLTAFKDRADFASRAFNSMHTSPYTCPKMIEKTDTLGGWFYSVKE